MSGSGLAFWSVEVRRMPGFERAGFTVADLSPGVNLIYGPNGSGKTTLARAIRHLLAPGEAGTGRASLCGRIELDGVAHDVELDAGLARCSRVDDGAAADYPKQEPEVLRRHAISLLDLAQTDEDLAAQVARELAGGYDVARARNTVKFATTTFNRNHGRVVDYESASAAYVSARRIQEDLASEENELGRLRDDLKQAQAAFEHRARLDLTLKRAEASKEVERAKADLAVYAEDR